MIDCRRVNDYFDSVLSDPSCNPPPEVAHHLADCPQCRALHDLLRQSAVAETTPARLARAARETLVSSLVLVKPLAPEYVRVAWLLAAGLAMSVALLAWMGFDGVRQMSRTQMWSLGALAVVAAVLLSVTLARLMAPGSRFAVAPLGPLVAVPVAAILAMGVLFPLEIGGPIPPPGASCFGLGLALAGPPALVLTVLVRRGVTVSAGMTGAAVGLAAGLVALAPVQGACLKHEAAHMLFWHASVLVCAALLGFLAARTVSARR
jgi:hypothetical protein